MLTVQTAAPDPKLLSLSEMKTALGIADDSQDTVLADLGAQLSEAIARECGVVADGVIPPTLRRETLIDKFRLSCGRPSLQLSRRFVVSIASVASAGAAMSGDDYELDKSAGALRRLDVNGAFIDWDSGVTTVTYDAGFDKVPGPLKLAARTILQETWANKDRDPTVKAERFEASV
jgi:hypothetical protein